MIVEWDIVASNGIIHAIAEPLRIPPPAVHVSQVSVRGRVWGSVVPKELENGDKGPTVAMWGAELCRGCSSHCSSPQVNGRAQPGGSVAAGLASALGLALVLAAGAGVAYWWVKRRQRDGQFGYLQVRAKGRRAWPGP